MRATALMGHTLRDAPADAEIASHRLLIRGAFLRQVSAGIYAWLPNGYRALRKVEQIVREEMDAQGATEILMPILQPAELWKQTGRWDEYGPVLYRLKDRSERDFCLPPTHEELVTFLASTELPSYRDLPVIPYHIQWKFRDEPRARGALLRGREFYMKDAYSFDVDEDGLKRSYEKMAEAYRRAFARCGLTAVQIEADPGAIGGTVNHEFTQPCSSGEDTFVACASCDYSANTEVAAGRAEPVVFDDAGAPEKVHTPGLTTVDRVAAHLGAEPRRLVKSLLFDTDDGLLCVAVPGDRELNEFKLRKVLGADARLLSDEAFAKRGIAKGFTGPVGLDGVTLWADRSLEGASGLITGANEADHHLTSVTPGRDFTPDAWHDLVVARQGDRCDRCGGELRLERGIEIGHIFQLGTKYSVPMNATFTDDDGTAKPFVMGCYGLGVSRVVASIVETHHDEAGITWPKAVSPFQVGVIVLAKGVDEAVDALERDLEAAGVDVLVDDRTGVSAGVRFADADLIGYPLQVVVGRTYSSDGRFEVKVRASGDRSEIDATADAVLGALAGCP